MATPIRSKVSLSKEKFASGAFRDAYEATVKAGGLQPGDKYVLKKFKKEQAKGSGKAFFLALRITRGRWFK